MEIEGIGANQRSNCKWVLWQESFGICDSGLTLTHHYILYVTVGLKTICAKPEISHQCSVFTGICLCGCVSWADFLLYPHKPTFCSGPVGVTSSNGRRTFLRAAHRDNVYAVFCYALLPNRMLWHIMCPSRFESTTPSFSLSMKSHCRYHNHSIGLQMHPIPCFEWMWYNWPQDFWRSHWTLKITHPHVLKRPQRRTKLCLYGLSAALM